MTSRAQHPQQAAAPEAGVVVGDAVFSVRGRYRYLLTRTWDPSIPPIGFVGLHPSAEDTTADPTIGRCVGLARGWGFGGVAVANLFALRATDPMVLLDTVAAGGDPVGPDNPTHLAAMAGHRTVVLGWGATAAAIDGADYPRRVAAELVAAGAAVFHLGLCRDGAPRHPLYLAGTTALLPWPGGGAR